MVPRGNNLCNRKIKIKMLIYLPNHVMLSQILLMNHIMPCGNI
jgi:hypothetical protein